MIVLNPEASSAVGIYRRMLPAQLRRRIARQVPSGARTRVKRRLRRLQARTGLLRALRGMRARRRWPHLFADGDRAAVLVRSATPVALVRRDVSPLALREANLDLVVSALEQAGVPYFAVRGTCDYRACVGVADTDRSRAAEALDAAVAAAPGYVAGCAADTAGTPSVGGTAKARRALADFAVVRIGMVWSDPGQCLELGLAYGCDVEFWQREGDRLRAPRPNLVTEEIPADFRSIDVPADVMTAFSARHSRQPKMMRTVPACAVPLPGDVLFPVDAVYTWVDGSDAAWAARRRRFDDQGYHAESANAARYLCRDELRYSLRSLEQNAPWIRTVYVVTAGQRPDWLDTSHPRIRVVDHEEIFDDPEALPTFNSHAIESRLHHIEGLSEHFLYFNDDMFLGRPVSPQDFFLSNGSTRAFFSPSFVPHDASSHDDRPVDAAGKNNRRIIADTFGPVLVQKLRHAPYPLRRSVLAEIETTFAEEHRRTMRSRFRSATDLSIPSSLHHYYAYLTSRAVPSQIDFTYLDLAKPEIERRLGILLACRDRQAFCINDTISDGHDVARQARLLNGFLEAYYPVPSTFERHPAPAARDRSDEEGARVA